ncbi:Crp/Fnr family transcriptional regulator [Wenyingzhuangia aestuarii]|uniref:Crp/Fnr family transcriptional regulator n=1 Tax=Wenyingzhuangia aestuarii TaxID=1647582 RepID=UPI00143A80DD|nr:Crp/Fnr family transcriptional regulator [Wenyingzhuangia aestuarii]NJB82343.1 CRP-like cAMP-binding protein [Wenyingzhuangia aestuarii]
MSQQLWFIENVNLFGKLCPHKFKEYASCHQFIDFKKNDYVYFSSDRANKLFLIQSGKIKLGYYTPDGEEVVKAILSKGQVFGEKALLGQDTRSEFAQVLNNTTTVCPIDVATLHNLMRDNQNFALNIYKFINYRIKKLERRLEILMFKDCKTRVTEFLTDLSKDFGVINHKNKSIEIEHPYTQKDIANLIGASRPSLNIILNELKEQGQIEFTRTKIILKKDLSVS